MDTAWLGIVGVVVGGAIGLGSAWLATSQQSAHARREIRRQCYLHLCNAVHDLDSLYIRAPEERGSDSKRALREELYGILSRQDAGDDVSTDLNDLEARVATLSRELGASVTLTEVYDSVNELSQAVTAIHLVAPRHMQEHADAVFAAATKGSPQQQKAKLGAFVRAARKDVKASP